MAMVGRGESVGRLQARAEALDRAVRALPSEVLTSECRARLLKLVRAERKFVDRLARADICAISDAHLRSTNFDHFEGLVHILQHPGFHFVGANAAMKSFPACVADGTQEIGKSNEAALESMGSFAHVDVVCMLQGQPVWLVVSNSNTRNLSWWNISNKKRGLRSRIELLLNAASLNPVARPSAILLFFREGLDGEIETRLQEEFRAERMARPSLESKVSCFETEFRTSEIEKGEWVNISILHDTTEWTSYRIEVLPASVSNPNTTKEQLSSVKQYPEVCGRQEEAEQGGLVSVGFNRPLLSGPIQKHVGVLGHSSRENLSALCITARQCWSQPGVHDLMQRPGRLINLDTTALVALVSGLSNGDAQILTEMSVEERERRFPKMANFIYDQALSEMETPLLTEFQEVLAHKLPVISQYVLEEFKSIVSANGGPHEQQRAEELLRCLKMVPNMASARVMALTETAKVKPRHKLVFGTGDFWQAPTLTANIGFVRAVRQTGMVLDIIQHRPCALTGA